MSWWCRAPGAEDGEGAVDPGKFPPAELSPAVAVWAPPSLRCLRVGLGA